MESLMRHFLWKFVHKKEITVVAVLSIAPEDRVPSLRGDKSNFSNKYFLYFIILFLFLFGFLPRLAFHPTALLLFRRPYNLANAILLFHI